MGIRDPVQVIWVEVRLDDLPPHRPTSADALQAMRALGCPVLGAHSKRRPQFRRLDSPGEAGPGLVGCEVRHRSHRQRLGIGSG